MDEQTILETRPSPGPQIVPHSREAEEAQIDNSHPIGRLSRFDRGSPLPGEFHGGFTVSEITLHIIMHCAEEAGLEGIEGNQFLQLLTSFNKAWVGKSTSAICSG